MGYLTHLLPNQLLIYLRLGTAKCMMKAAAPTPAPPLRVLVPCRALQAPRPLALGSPHRDLSLDLPGPSLRGSAQGHPVPLEVPLDLELDLQLRAVGAPLAVRE